jgi:hypothetical protein
MGVRIMTNTGRLTYRDIFERLAGATEKELDMEVQIGLETGVVAVRSFEHITDATDGEDLSGNTLILETSVSTYEPQAFGSAA